MAPLFIVCHLSDRNRSNFEFKQCSNWIVFLFKVLLIRWLESRTLLQQSQTHGSVFTRSQLDRPLMYRCCACVCARPIEK